METPSKTVKKGEECILLQQISHVKWIDCNSTTVENHRFQNVKTLPFILVLGPPPLSVFCHFEIRLCCTFEKNLRIASPKLCTSASKLFTSSVQQKFSRRFHIDIFEITVDFKSQIGK